MSSRIFGCILLIVLAGSSSLAFAQPFGGIFRGLRPHRSGQPATPEPPAGPTSRPFRTASTNPVTMLPVSVAMRAGQMEPCPVLWYSFDDDDGDSTARDSSGNKHHGKILGAKWTENGRVGGCREFDGKTSRVQLPRAESVPLVNGLTFAAWIKIKPNPNQQVTVVIAKWYNGDNCEGPAALQVMHDRRPQFSVYSPNMGQMYCQGTKALETNKWIHVAGTYDNKVAKLYVNGELVHQQPFENALQQPSESPVTVGGHASNNDRSPFSGWIDEAMVFDRALSEKEIRELCDQYDLLIPGVALPRSDESDQVILRDGRRMLGAIQRDQYTLTTPLGPVTLPAGKVIGLASAGGDQAWVLLTDGQALLGKLDEPTVKFRLSVGSVLEIPVNRLRNCGYQVTKDKPVLCKAAGLVLVLRDGQRVVLPANAGKLEFQTAVGMLDLTKGDFCGVLTREGVPEAPTTAPADDEPPADADETEGEADEPTVMPSGPVQQVQVAQQPRVPRAATTRHTTLPTTAPAASAPSATGPTATGPATTAPAASGPATQPIPSERFHVITLANGTRLSGTLVPDHLTVKTLTGADLTVTREQIHSVLGTAARVLPPEEVTLTLDNGDRLLGRIQTAKLVIKTEFGSADVPTASISEACATQPAESPDGAAADELSMTLADGTELQGKCSVGSLDFHVTPSGPDLKVPLERIAALDQPGALPAPEVVKEIEKLIGQLAAESHVDRKKAQAALEKMGKRILPVLKKHTADRDPEVRQAVEQLIDRCSGIPLPSGIEETVPVPEDMEVDGGG